MGDCAHGTNDWSTCVNCLRDIIDRYRHDKIALLSLLEGRYKTAAGLKVAIRAMLRRMK